MFGHKMKRYLSYFKYVLIHKYYVFLEYMKEGLPIQDALFHDWDKFLPSMFTVYAKHFRNADGTKRIHSPNDVAFKEACNEHYNRNNHHWEHWVTPRPVNECLKMSLIARKKMLADWKGTGRSLGMPDTKAWYLANKDKILLHPETREWIEERLDV